VVHVIDTGSELGFDSVTLNVNAVVPASPSAALKSPMLIVGCESSFTIVPTAWGSAIVANCGVVRLTKKSSFGSNLVSGFTAMVMVVVVLCGENVAVPLTTGV
jgi:hypothetical protein